MPADKFRGRLHHNIGSPLDGPGKNRGGGGIVDHQRHALLVGDAGQGLNLGNVELGIAQRLGVEGLGLRR